MTDKKKLELISGYVQKCYHESYYDMSNAIADIANILESETINPVPSIPIVGGGSVASDRTEQCESFRPDVVVPSEAESIVNALVEWSLAYPRDRVYHVSKMSMDNELIALEERAKKYFTELNHEK